MSIEVLMPAIGAGASDGKILRWLKKVGDTVTPGEVLAEIETDKAVVELDAIDAGVLHTILVPEGAQGIAVGSTIALLSDGSEEKVGACAVVEGSAVPAQASSTQVAVPELAGTQGESAKHRHVASPLARRLAQQWQINLEGLQGSGPKGRIVRVDVERAQAASQPTLIAEIPHQPPPLVVPALESVHVQQGTKRLPLTSMRKTIARRLSESKQQIPHFYMNCVVRMDAMLELREQLNTQGAKASPAWRLSVNDMLVFAVAKALCRVPAVNASWTEDAILLHQQVNICVAVATEGGLMTPIVRDADRKGMAEIAADIRMLAAKARSGKLLPDEYQGGGFTISNLGMYGIHSFSAIINPPQSAILAVGAVEKCPVVEGDALAVGQVMSLTLSADHRVIDGAVGATFLAELRKLLESPLNLLV